jgi:TRAP-type uncharacterized transport system fused permease subunit
VQLGIDRVAAHLFIFYVGMLSMITPPVCFATFTAAAIARADFWKTAMAGMQYGIAAFILPFVFPFSPGLLMNGGPTQVTVSFVAAVLGLFGLAAALVGFLFRPLSPVFRILMFVFGCAVMVGPYANAQMLIATIVGLAGGALIVVYEWFASRKLPMAAQSSLQVGK